MPGHKTIAFIAAALAVPAFAQERAVTPAELIERLTGKTAYFMGGGSLVGIERFHGDGTTTWLRADGSCTRGILTTPENQICFTYDDTPHITWCWYAFEQDGRIEVVASDDGSRQVITRITNAPVACSVYAPGV